ncbi:MAG: tRNA lysidine(34) synthetase TilS [Phascolarctobacterium sp.]|nr:tRNA lysidine(34) synthetase TilS [Phascolarctobacterium sp.]
MHPAVKKLYRSLKRNIPRGSRVLLAVSGGTDSLAMADGAAMLMEEGWLTASVLHVEHGIRGDEALHDAVLVEKFCSERCLPYKCIHVDVPACRAEKKLSLEAAARFLRYEALQREAEAVNAGYIVTGHQLDDQAETVLLRLLRGTASSGLGAMKMRTGNILRPLLHLTRDDLEAYCTERNIICCHDSSNDDMAYTRNRIRHELLPYLEKNYNRSVKKSLAQTAELLREDEEFFAGLVKKLLSERAAAENGDLLLDTRDWEQIVAPVRRRLLRECYFLYGGGELGYRHTTALDKICLTGHSGKVLRLPAGIAAGYAYGKLRFSREIKSGEKGFSIECGDDFNGRKFTVPGGEVVLEILSGEKPPMGKGRVIYPLQLCSGKIELRSRRTGDSFKPYSGTGGKKLKDYFIDKKIPREDRNGKILVCCGEKILGILGMDNGAFVHGNYDKWLVAKFIPEGSENGNE